ncbi:hypothetical protein CDIK_1766 [Cucumispora dikerogammari]|nr:hypothetical protein CDIK_1766 [Cucumispora dikerogammari]
MSSKYNQEALSQYKRMYTEKHLADEKEYRITVYLLFFITFSVFSLFAVPIENTKTFSYDKSQIFVLSHCTYLYIITSIIQPDPEKIKLSWIITILFLVKYFSRVISDGSWVSTILFFILTTSFIIYHVLTIRKVSFLYISSIKKRLSILDTRNTLVFDVNLLNRVSIRLTLFSLAEQLMYISMDAVVAYIVFIGAMGLGSLLNIIFILLEFSLLYISKTQDSYLIRIIALCLYIIHPLFNIFEALLFSLPRTGGYTLQKNSSILFLIIFFCRIALNYTVALYAYFDIDNFGRGLAAL